MNFFLQEKNFTFSTYDACNLISEPVIIKNFGNLTIDAKPFKEYSMGLCDREIKKKMLLTFSAKANCEKTNITSQTDGTIYFNNPITEYIRKKIKSNESFENANDRKNGIYENHFMRNLRNLTASKRNDSSTPINSEYIKLITNAVDYYNHDLNYILRRVLIGENCEIDFESQKILIKNVKIVPPSAPEWFYRWFVEIDRFVFVFPLALIACISGIPLALLCIKIKVVISYVFYDSI